MTLNAIIKLLDREIGDCDPVDDEDIDYYNHLNYVKLLTVTRHCIYRLCAATDCRLESDEHKHEVGMDRLLDLEMLRDRLK